ncbi:acetylxylan esterase, partial [bacterium]|nr:acetylxylan esterase [bacterium]
AEERQWWLYPKGLPDEANALRFNIQAILAHTRRFRVPSSRAQWEKRRADVGQRLKHALGLDPWPEKAPLNARVTGRTERDAYTIENVVFESQPKFFVTANVYVPKAGKRPLPAVIVSAGHAMREGKNYDLYRTAQLGLVGHGFLVLAYDPIGQGERRRPGCGHLVGYAATLVGQCNIGHMVWDTVRALDYLLTRADVDPKRIGTAGNSGGGLNAMYVTPVEPRLATGASFCCLCSYHAWIKDGGNHCICNHVPGIAQVMEQFELAGLCAPRPFMAGNGAKDPIFPIAGVRRTIERATKIYALYDAEGKVALHEAPLPHGWSQPLREAGVGWMLRWLQNKGDGSPVPEGPVKLEDWQSEPFQALKDGKMPAGARSYVQVVRDRARELIAAYPPVPTEKSARSAWAKALREKLWDTLGGQPTFAPKATTRGTFTWHGKSVERLTIQTEDALEVPALLIHPAKAASKASVVVYLSDDGKAAARTSPVVASLLKQGIAVLALDVRAVGEVTVHANHCASDAILLGRPLLAQQAWDVLCAVKIVGQRRDIDSRRVGVFGKGSVGLIAMLAGALSDDVAAVASDGAIGSFTHAIADPLPQPLWVYAPSILRVADVSQLAALCAPRPLLWANPVGIRRRPLPEAEPAQAVASFLQSALTKAQP